MRLWVQVLRSGAESSTRNSLACFSYQHSLLHSHLDSAYKSAAVCFSFCSVMLHDDSWTHEITFGGCKTQNACGTQLIRPSLLVRAWAMHYLIAYLPHIDVIVALLSTCRR